jgi:hypothetical protein
VLNKKPEETKANDTKTKVFCSEKNKHEAMIDYLKTSILVLVIFTNVEPWLLIFWYAT